MEYEIVVVGSINMDLVVRTNRMPEIGETIPGNDFKTIPGGKGANQAVAACRMGATTTMIGCVGQDVFGPSLITSLKDAGVDTNNVTTIAEIASGTATIIVDSNGENCIVVVPGTNGLVTPKFLQGYENVLKNAKLILTQFEIPLDSVEYLTSLSKNNNIPIIINPAPAKVVPEGFFSSIDYLVVNETEASFFTEIEVINFDSGWKAAEKLRKSGAKNVIITMGEKGALLLNEEIRKIFTAQKVDVVDTTAAGDSFVGGLAAMIVKGNDLIRSMEFAIAAGTLAVTKLGAQPSIPSRSEVEVFMSEKDKK